MASPAVNEGSAAARPEYRTYQRVLDWLTAERMQLVNISERVNGVVRESGIVNGLVHLQSLHTTTSLFLGEWQNALIHDIRAYLGNLVDGEHAWRHNDPQYSECERRNADSHLRGMLMGQTLSLQVRQGSVLLGTWQSIVLAEFDGPRNRSVAIQVSGL